MKFKITVIFLFLVFRTLSQSIVITSFSDNPLEISPLVGANVTVNYTYTSENGSTENHIYIGLEVLDAQHNYVKTVVETTLQNQQAGTNINNSVDFFISSSHQLSSELASGQYYQVKAILYKSGGWIEAATAGYWNTPTLVLQDTSGYTFSQNPINLGADISWFTEMEANGFTWKNNNGNATALLPLLKEINLNAVRLRVWVNPENSNANGWCNINDVVTKAELAKNAGLDVMLSIHYSDWWADPGKQNKPSAWENYSVSQLETAIYNHTTAILTALQAKNCTPKWVQIGNETDDGLLWPTGKASVNGFTNYAKFVNAGANAVKTFNSNIKTILHISNGNNNNLFRWNIDGLLNANFQSNTFDIIGMSLYPTENNWQTMVNDAYNNMLDVKSRYNKDVMLVEVGFPNNRFDISFQYLTYIIEQTKKAGGLGVFYWEPIAHKNWRSYNKGAWNDDGSPSIAMEAFSNAATLSVNSALITDDIFRVYPNPTSKYIVIQAKKKAPVLVKIYDVKGVLCKQKSIKINDKFFIDDLKSGIYIVQVNNQKQKIIIE